MPWLGAARAREVGRRRRYPDSLLDLDASVARDGPEQTATEPLRSRARYSWRRDATRYQPLLHPAGRHADQADCQLALLALREARSEEHTSELQSLTNLVCRLLLEKKNSS